MVYSAFHKETTWLGFLVIIKEWTSSVSFTTHWLQHCKEHISITENTCFPHKYPPFHHRQFKMKLPELRRLHKRPIELYFTSGLVFSSCRSLCKLWTSCDSLKDSSRVSENKKQILELLPEKKLESECACFLKPKFLTGFISNWLYRDVLGICFLYWRSSLFSLQCFFTGPILEDRAGVL